MLVLTLPQAISLTLSNSDSLRKVTLSRVKKQIELTRKKLEELCNG